MTVKKLGNGIYMTVLPYGTLSQRYSAPEEKNNVDVDEDDDLYDEDDMQPVWPSSDDLRFVVYYDEEPGEPITCIAMLDLYDAEGDPWDQSVMWYLKRKYPDKDLSKIQESAENSFEFDYEFSELPEFQYTTKEEFAALFEKFTGIKYSGKAYPT